MQTLHAYGTGTCRNFLSQPGQGLVVLLLLQGVHFCGHPSCSSFLSLIFTESKLIAASDALRASINLTDIAKEAQDHGVSIGGTCPNFHTRLFEETQEP